MNEFDFAVFDKIMERHCRIIVIFGKSNLSFAKYALIMGDKKTTKKLLETVEEIADLLEEAIRHKSLAAIMYLIRPGESTVGVF